MVLKMRKSSKLINRSKRRSTPIKEQTATLPHAAWGRGWGTEGSTSRDFSQHLQLPVTTDAFQLQSWSSSPGKVLGRRLSNAPASKGRQCGFLPLEVGIVWVLLSGHCARGKSLPPRWLTGKRAGEAVQMESHPEHQAVIDLLF